MAKEFKQYVMTFEAYQAMEQQMLAEQASTETSAKINEDALSSIKAVLKGNVRDVADLFALAISDDEILKDLANAQGKIKAYAASQTDEEVKKGLEDAIAKAEAKDKDAITKLKMLYNVFGKGGFANVGKPGMSAGISPETQAAKAAQVAAQ